MLIVANWKAYVETKEKAKELFALSKRLSTAIKRVRIILLPPAPFLAFLAQGNRTKISFGAQDISMTTIGASTGEVSGTMLKQSGATYVLIGHSERRALGETNDTVQQKVRRALSVGLTPIICVGEKERDHDAQYLSYIKEQIQAVFEPLTVPERLKVVIAYEPVWAIGKSAGDALPEREVGEMVLYIRKIIGHYLLGKSAQKIPILYGGSVEPENIRGLAGGAHVDGFLIGHASVQKDMFRETVRALV